MKKIASFFVIATLLTFVVSKNAFGFSFHTPIHPPTQLSGSQFLRADQFVKLSAKQFSHLTGKKLNFFQRMFFNLAKREIRQELRKNPDVLMPDIFNKGRGGTSALKIIYYILIGFLILIVIILTIAGGKFK